MFRFGTDVKKLVRRVGLAVLESYCRSDALVSRKDDGSLLTSADMLADKMLYRGLKRYGFPVLSEEYADSAARLRSEYVWVVDPIDGTSGFVTRNGDFAVMVGLAYRREPVLGVVYVPIKDELYYAERGKGAYLEQGGIVKRLRVSTVSSADRARVVLSRSGTSERVVRVLRQAAITRDVLRRNGVGVKMGEIVKGVADAYLTFASGMGQWDICAPHIILEEAGGKMTGVHGETLRYNGEDQRNPYGILATNGAVHKVFLDAVRASCGPSCRNSSECLS